MCDCNNKSNEKKLRETDPTQSQILLLPATVKPNKWERQSLEQRRFMAVSRKENGWLVLENLVLSLVVQLCPTLCDPMKRSTPGLPVHHQLLEFTQTPVHRVGCHPTISSSVVPFSSCLQSFPASVFSNESTLGMRWPKYWSFSSSIIPSKEIPGLISFGMDWLDLLVVQGTLKSLLQNHSSKASILWCSAFFVVQLSHPYTTTGKTIALTRWTFVGKVMSLLFNMLSRSTF